MSLSEAIRQITLLKEHAKECLEQEAGEMALAAVSEKDIEALTTAAAVLEDVRILNGIFSKEAET